MGSKIIISKMESAYTIFTKLAKRLSVRGSGFFEYSIEPLVFLKYPHCLY